jgi:hypothetical protein
MQKAIIQIRLECLDVGIAWQKDHSTELKLRLAISCHEALNGQLVNNFLRVVVIYIQVDFEILGIKMIAYE